MFFILFKSSLKGSQNIIDSHLMSPKLEGMPIVLEKAKFDLWDVLVDAVRLSMSQRLRQVRPCPP